jgi:anthranilate synthase component 2
MNSPILIIDNYDSFTYNLVHLLEEITGVKPRTIRVDALRSEDLTQAAAVVISPGPGLPEEMGSLMDWVRIAINTRPTLGVCLGHQAIACALGGSLLQLPAVYHGIARTGHVVISDPMYHAVASEFDAGSYHSWTVAQSGFPEELILTAQDKQGDVLSFIHRSKPVWGVQYHPESILTPSGKQVVSNWLASWQ